jgi:hypothetical protein
MRRARASPDSGPPIERVGSGDRAMLAMSAGAVVQQQLGAVLSSTPVRSSTCRVPSGCSRSRSPRLPGYASD